MKVRFVICIHASRSGCSSADVYMERMLDLPFMPFPGLEVSSGDWECRVESCWYQHDMAIFSCLGVDNKEISNAKSRGQEHRAIEEIVAEYLGNGWEVGTFGGREAAKATGGDDEPYSR